MAGGYAVLTATGHEVIKASQLGWIGGIRKMVRAHPQDVLAQLADMKGVLAEMTDKSRTPRRENATRYGEANFWIRSKNQCDRGISH